MILMGDDMNSQAVYYVGKDRKNKSLTKLFLDLAQDDSEKTIYVDAGVYDIFNEYKKVGMKSPPDDVTSPDYFEYNAFCDI